MMVVMHHCNTDNWHHLLFDQTVVFFPALFPKEEIVVVVVFVVVAMDVAVIVVVVVHYQYFQWQSCPFAQSAMLLNHCNCNIGNWHRLDCYDRNHPAGFAAAATAAAVVVGAAVFGCCFLPPAFIAAAALFDQTVVLGWR